MGAPGGLDFLLCAVCPKLTNLSPQSHCCRLLYTRDYHAAEFTMAGVKRVCPVSTHNGDVPTHSFLEKTTPMSEEQRIIQLFLG